MTITTCTNPACFRSFPGMALNCPRCGSSDVRYDKAPVAAKKVAA